MERSWEHNYASEFAPVRTISDSLKDLEGFIMSIHATKGGAEEPQSLMDSKNDQKNHRPPLGQSGCNYFDSAIDGPEAQKPRLWAQNAIQEDIIIPPWIDVPDHSRFFVIKSSSLENVKKSFYNGIWSSTYFGNKRLSEAYAKLPKGSKIFLFFSVNASGRFCGVAEMISGLESGLDISIWADSERYNSAFKVRWIVVRDVQNRLLKQFLIPSNDMKPVTNSRDTQEIPPAICKSILKLFKYDQTNVQSFLDQDYV